MKESYLFGYPGACPDTCDFHFMTIVCAVSARRSSHSASYGAGDEELLDVVIMIKKLSDTDNLFQYSSDIKGEKLLGILDLDDLEIVENGNRFRANFGKHGEDNQQIFAIQNFIEYNLFKDSILECRMLCEMTLRLNSFARDLYFAGIYSSQVAGEDGVYLSEVLQTIRDQQSFPMEFSIFDTSSSKIIEENEDAIDPKIQDSLSASSRTRQHVISDINCVFCGVQKMMEISKDFAVHPYVPATFQNKTIYMCVLCLQNWKEFREKAIKDNQLILKNEVNEELCGKKKSCNDSPCPLILGNLTFSNIDLATQTDINTPQASVLTHQLN